MLNDNVSCSLAVTSRVLIAWRIYGPVGGDRLRTGPPRSGDGEDIQLRWLPVGGVASEKQLNAGAFVMRWDGRGWDGGS